MRSAKIGVMSGHRPWRSTPPSTPEQVERREKARRELEAELAEYYDTHDTSELDGEEVTVEQKTGVDDWTSLIGRRVHVNIGFGDANVTMASGVLRSLSDDGEAGIETGLGMFYVWPVLAMEDLYKEPES
jgi:hypothetical protein